MSPALLLADRTNRTGDRTLGTLRLTLEALAYEAGMGRGILIADCRSEALPRHVTHAIRNAAVPAVIAPSTYAMGEEIADDLDGLSLPTWCGQRGTECGAGDSNAEIQIAVPEQLYLVERRIRAKTYAPGLAFVVDAEGYLDRAAPEWYQLSRRGESVCRFKAACQAAGGRLPLVVWTTQPAMSFRFSTLSRIYGVDAWLCLDGQTLRTACTGSATPLGPGSALQVGYSEQEDTALVATA